MIKCPLQPFCLAISSHSSYITADPVRLVSQTGYTGNLTAGRLEIFINGEWGTVCINQFGVTDADVACRQLEFDGSIAIHTAINLG